MNRLNVLLSVVAVAVVAFVVGYIVGASTVEEGEISVSEEKIKSLPTVAQGIEHCPFKGPAEAKVTIVEFTDYQ